MEVKKLKSLFSKFEDHWSPKIAGELNGQYVKLAKLKGEFVWHKHDDEDELFYVVEGSLDIYFKDGVKKLNPGEFIIVPRGVEHKPVAHEEVQVLLFEPKSTLNTGDSSPGNLTKENLDWI